MTLPKVVDKYIMSKSVYIGVSSVARKVKKIYIGVDSVARKVKKGYIGVGGVAKLFYSASNPPTYYSSTTLAQGGQNPAATSIGDYALFGGGMVTSNWYSNYVTTYDSSLTKSTATNLCVPRYSLAATSIGDYALFGGGRDKSSAYATVDTYTSSLTRGTATDLSASRYKLAATSTNNYAVFTQGVPTSSSVSGSVFDYYNSSLTRSSSSASYAAADRNLFDLSATSINNNILVSGKIYGITTGLFTTDLVTLIDSSLTEQTSLSLQHHRSGAGATTVGNYALFGGGIWAEVIITTAPTQVMSDTRYVDAYDSSLTHTTPADFTSLMPHPEACTCNDYAIFKAGQSNGSGYPGSVEYYDSSLTHGVVDYEQNTGYGAATSIGDYALFGGGLDDDNDKTDVVYVYTTA